jgi:hypothetical protein
VPLPAGAKLFRWLAAFHPNISFRGPQRLLVETTTRG